MCLHISNTYNVIPIQHSPNENCEVPLLGLKLSSSALVFLCLYCMGSSLPFQLSISAIRFSFPFQPSVSAFRFSFQFPPFPLAPLRTGNWKSRERETGTGNGNGKREIVLGSSPRFPNECVTSQGRLETRLLNGIPLSHCQ